MLRPDQRLFEADLSSAEFRIGESKGCWGVAGEGERPADAAWPKVYLWVAAAPRENAPNRFYLALEAEGYRVPSPTGTFWDQIKKAPLAFSAFPKGKPGSRVDKVFRTDIWASTNKALYHPYDRVAAQGHAGWSTEQPHLIWDSNHTIVDFLDEVRKLLNCGDYIGV